MYKTPITLAKKIISKAGRGFHIFLCFLFGCVPSMTTKLNELNRLEEHEVCRFCKRDI